MPINRTLYTTGRLAGIGYYSRNHREILVESLRALRDPDPWVVAGGLHNIGHLARRFGIVDWPLVRAAERAVFRRPYSRTIRFALNDMRDDIANYMPFKKRLANLDFERRYGDE